jgi:hypothetical protein
MNKKAHVVIKYLQKKVQDQQKYMFKTLTDDSPFYSTIKK